MAQQSRQRRNPHPRQNAGPERPTAGHSAGFGANLAHQNRDRRQVEPKVGGAGFVDAKTGEVAVHRGARSSFPVWANEHTSYDWNLSEAALWHKLGSKEDQAYARSDMVEKRREMMSEWARS